MLFRVPFQVLATPTRFHQLGEREKAVVAASGDPYAEIGVGVLVVYV